MLFWHEDKDKGIIILSRQELQIHLGGGSGIFIRVVIVVVEPSIPVIQPAIPMQLGQMNQKAGPIFRGDVRKIPSGQFKDGHIQECPIRNDMGRTTSQH